jgi:tetratricopeptide (TPR) repeat protein
MTDLTSVAIPAPKDWQALERHSRLLFELSFGDSAVQNNGRTGQPQHGVDIFGRRDGGKGRWVGVQCKGKDAGYGGEVTEKELRAEVKKSEKFVPPIEEFVLVTTAPNDEKIQRTARLLQDELRSKGRELVVQVWGWERVQQEIGRFPEAVKEFHPDITPFTDKILDAGESIKQLVAEAAGITSTGLISIDQKLAQVLGRLPQISGDTSARNDAFDKELHDQIDGYRDLLRGGKPRTALDLLTRLNDRLGLDASQRIRFRILSNIGASYYDLGEYEKASDFLLEAAPFNPNDPGSIANKAAALLIKGKKAEAHQAAAEALERYPDHRELALVRLQALAPSETIESVWQTLSEVARNSPIVFAFRVGAMRQSGDQDWPSLVDEGLRLHPEDAGLKIIRAEGVIDRFLRNDPNAVGLLGPRQEL